MFRALHSYLSLTSHSLLHLSPNVQIGCEWVLTPHLPVHHCGCLSPRRASPESNDVEGVSLEVRQTKWTHILAHLTDSPARTGPNCKNARPNLSWFFGLLTFADCSWLLRGHESTPETGEDLGPRSIRTTNSIWDQTSLQLSGPT